MDELLEFNPIILRQRKTISHRVSLVSAFQSINARKSEDKTQIDQLIWFFFVEFQDNDKNLIESEQNNRKKQTWAKCDWCCWVICYRWYVEPIENAMQENRCMCEL